MGRRVPCPSQREPRYRNGVSRTSTAPGWPRQAPRGAAGGGLPACRSVRAARGGGGRAVQHATTATRGDLGRRGNHPDAPGRAWLLVIQRISVVEPQTRALRYLHLVSPAGSSRSWWCVGASGPGSRASALPAVIPVSKSFPTNYYPPEPLSRTNQCSGAIFGTNSAPGWKFWYGTSRGARGGRKTTA